VQGPITATIEVKRSLFDFPVVLLSSEICACTCPCARLYARKWKLKTATMVSDGEPWATVVRPEHRKYFLLTTKKQAVGQLRPRRVHTCDLSSVNRLNPREGSCD
jgi:hypothetical protein